MNSILNYIAIACVIIFSLLISIKKRNKIVSISIWAIALIIAGIAIYELVDLVSH